MPNATHEILSNETKDNKSNDRGNLDPMQQNEKEKNYCTERFQKKMRYENRKKETKMKICTLKSAVDSLYKSDTVVATASNSPNMYCERCVDMA